MYRIFRFHTYDFCIVGTVVSNVMNYKVVACMTNIVTLRFIKRHYEYSTINY